jgi:hypothetical protein
MITIQAAQASTGIILAEDFAWDTQQPGQVSFKRTFETEKQAREFCSTELRKIEDIEFLMTMEDGTSVRLAPDEQE